MSYDNFFFPYHTTPFVGRAHISTGLVKGSPRRAQRERHGQGIAGPRLQVTGKVGAMFRRCVWRVGPGQGWAPLGRRKWSAGVAAGSRCPGKRGPRGAGPAALRCRLPLPSRRPRAAPCRPALLTWPPPRAPRRTRALPNPSGKVSCGRFKRNGGLEELG